MAPERAAASAPGPGPADDRVRLTSSNFIRKSFMPADIVRRIRQILDR